MQTTPDTASDMTGPHDQRDFSLYRGRVERFPVSAVLIGNDRRHVIVEH